MSPSVVKFYSDFYPGQRTTRYIKHLAESGIFMVSIFNKHSSGLIVQRFECQTFHIPKRYTNLFASEWGTLAVTFITSPYSIFSIFPIDFSTLLITVPNSLYCIVR